MSSRSDTVEARLSGDKQQVSDAPTKRVEVMRKDNSVVVAIHCTDDYAAMLLYDEITAELRDGYVSIELDGAVPVKSKEP
ncbi:MAG: hypothetical protein KGL39_53890 [Patescibacteria group bacterium]|nr:hypothetical protein [Patescibacteria group bacterium]